MFAKLRKGSFIIDTVQPIVMAFSVFLVIYLLVAQPHKVDGNSMHPTFFDKEFILTDKLSYRNGNPERGDIVVFHAPEPFKSDFIKRIIALPGETVMVKGGRVYINNKVLEESYLPQSVVTVSKSALQESVPFLVPENHYMVFGDNRDFSYDGREFGPINKRSIIGKAWITYWPLNRIRLIKHENYTL